jgi:small subunit ribosomal protein S1
VWRVSDVVQEGQEVEALVLAVDSEAQRISLSLKALETRPAPAKKDSLQEADADADAAAAKAVSNTRSGTLKGGLDRATGGEKFGLRW